MAQASNGKSAAYAAFKLGTEVEPWEFDLNPLGDNDVELKVTHSGICHSDLHCIAGDWGPQEGRWPIVPGHEILGLVTQVGKNVEKFKIGDRVGVGPQALSCFDCPCCDGHRENYCPKRPVMTYAGLLPNGFVTKGGYAHYNRTHQRFVVRIPDSLPNEGTAPLLCAGITTYAPLKYAGVKPGVSVAIVGIGGLGHLGIQWAAAMGGEVTAISTSPDKEAEAKQLGAHKFIPSKDLEKMQAAANSFDVILNTTSADLPWALYLNLLKPFGQFMQVGAPPSPLQISPFQLLMKGISIRGTGVGSPQEAEEMLEFAAQHNIVSRVETLPLSEVNSGIQKVANNDVRYRVVLIVP